MTDNFQNKKFMEIIQHKLQTDETFKKQLFDVCKSHKMNTNNKEYYKNNHLNINRNRYISNILKGNIKSMTQKTFEKYQPWNEEQLIVIRPILKKEKFHKYNPYKSELFKSSEIDEAHNWLKEICKK